MGNEVPIKLIGAWRRESIENEGESAYEDSQVIWLQTPTRFADVRVTLPTCDVAQESFGGYVDWQNPELLFHHDLDLKEQSDKDIGTLSWQEDVLIEDGTYKDGGHLISYRERWTRQTTIAPSVITLEHYGQEGLLKGIAIKIDNHAIVMVNFGEFSSTYFRFTRGQWARQWSIGKLSSFQFPDQPIVMEQYDQNGVMWKCTEVLGY